MDTKPGSVSWLEKIYEQYKTDVFRLCLSILTDIDLAEDAMQDTFERAYRGKYVYQGECQEKAWISGTSGGNQAGRQGYHLSADYWRSETLGDCGYHGNNRT